MNKDRRKTFDQKELAASLAPLGIRQISERMEVSPLLVGQGDLTQDQNGSICCTCKIPWEQLDENGNMPVPTVEGAVGSPTGRTGGFNWPL